MSSPDDSKPLPKVKDQRRSDRSPERARGSPSSCCSGELLPVKHSLKLIHPGSGTPAPDDKDCIYGGQTEADTEVNDNKSTSPSRSLPPSDVGEGGLDLRRDLQQQNLFIFHLPSHWTELEVEAAFSEFGNIISSRVVKRPDGSSKGYGFVCFGSVESAMTAMKAMDGKAVGEGKRLKVSIKKTPEECLHQQVEKLLSIPRNEAFDRERECSLFVFHIPPHWHDLDLRAQFLPFGPVTAAKVSHKADGTSRGYGFVTCADPQRAALAILHLNGLEVCNKRLKVQLKHTGRVRNIRMDSTVFVFHLPSDWTESLLRQFFRHCGRVISASVQRDARGRSRGFGFVTFDRPESALQAIRDLNGVSVGIKRLKVSLKKDSRSEEAEIIPYKAADFDDGTNFAKPQTDHYQHIFSHSAPRTEPPTATRKHFRPKGFYPTAPWTQGIVEMERMKFDVPEQ